MKCPFCQHDENEVYQTDDSTLLTSIRRGRFCSKCRRIFETSESATGRDYNKRNNGTVNMFDDDKMETRFNSARTRERKKQKHFARLVALEILKISAQAKSSGKQKEDKR